MKKLVILIEAMLMLLSCQRFVRHYYFWEFVNNSNEAVYIILDTDSFNGTITERNQCVGRVNAHSTRKVSDHKPWREIVKDSMYVYVINGEMIDLPINDLSPENAERITPEMVLDRKTIYHSQTSGKFTLTYP